MAVWREPHPQLSAMCCAIQLSVNVGINRLSPPVLFVQQTGLYEYKVFGVLEDCPPAVLADVYMDLDYRKQWDQYVKGEHHLLFVFFQKSIRKQSLLLLVLSSIKQQV